MRRGLETKAFEDCSLWSRSGRLVQVVQCSVRSLGKGHSAGEGLGNARAIFLLLPGLHLPHTPRVCSNPCQQLRGVIVYEIGFCGNPRGPKTNPQHYFCGKIHSCNRVTVDLTKFWNIGHWEVRDWVSVQVSTAVPFWQLLWRTLK